MHFSSQLKLLGNNLVATELRFSALNFVWPNNNFVGGGFFGI
jgi:hypothetical protein